MNVLVLTVPVVARCPFWSVSQPFIFNMPIQFGIFNSLFLLFVLTLMHRFESCFDLLELIILNEVFQPFSMMFYFDEVLYQ